MNDTKSDVDLATFEREPALKPPRRSPLRWLVPGGVVLAFAIILALSFGDFWRGSVEVTVLRPRSSSTAVETGRLAFQAAGWVEPDPFPLHVVPLTPGFVKEVLVEESDRVEANQVVARLVDDDARLELLQAEANLAAAQATRERADADLARRLQDFEEAISLTERVEVAAASAKSRAAEATLRAQAAARATAEVTVAEEELSLQRYLESQGAAGPRQVELAEARVESARAAAEMSKADAARAAADQQVSEARSRAAHRDQALRIEEQRLLEMARHELARAEADVSAAEAALQIARLRMDRTDVRSPWDGIVLERLTLPGFSSGGDHVAVCELYDPARLRVRVDVPFEEVGKTSVGQRAEILCESRPGQPYQGEVVRRVQRADIQKVTLEVQVRLVDPDELVRPDMLCQVRFLSTSTESSGETDQDTTVLVPSDLVVPGADGPAVWVIDPVHRRAELRPVQLGSEHAGWTEVHAGINLSDKLIDRGRERLDPGTRIRVQGGP